MVDSPAVDRTELKLCFAANLLRSPDDPMKAAFATTPDTGLALQIARQWIDDPVVKVEQERLLNTSEAKSFLPSKEQQAKDIYAMATNDRLATEDRLKAHRLYAEVMGHIEKPAVGGGINILTQGVMIVKDAGSDADWQEKAAQQQRALTANASVN